MGEPAPVGQPAPAGEPRWFTQHPDDHSQRYAARFRRLAAEGADLDGEARLVDALLPRRARVLDAGCGGGRTGAALHARGHRVVGVDADRRLIAAAREDHPEIAWRLADLATLDLDELRRDIGDARGEEAGEDDRFDAVVLAGNVMVFLAPDTEAQVLLRLAAVLRPGAVLVAGFATDRKYSVAAFDADASAAGLALEHRFATWDLRPWTSDASWAVSVLRSPRQG